MKLYRVEVSKILYIVAENSLEAELDADHYYREDDNEPIIEVTEATRKTIKRDGWEGALVYGHGPDYPSTEAVKLND